MDKMKVIGGRVLRGTVKTSGAKNSALKLLFASLLADGRHTFNSAS
jgi:UDP-N-acetylglucosamine 1-carboxyvinyltransferase